MRLIDADELKESMQNHTDYKGYLTCDPEEIIDQAPTVAEEITGFATSRVTNDVVGRFGEKILDNVKQEVIQSIGARLYQEGAITIEKVEDRARQEMVLIGRVSVLKKEDNQHGEHQG